MIMGAEETQASCAQRPPCAPGKTTVDDVLRVVRSVIFANARL